MRNRAGARSQGAQRVRELFEEVRQGLNPFAAMPNRTDPRVQGATVYPINSFTELVLIRNGLTVFPAILGEPTEVEGWLAAHVGLIVAIDATTGRISVTRILSAPETDKLQPPALTTENRPFLDQIEGLQMSDLVPARLIREHLMELDEAYRENLTFHEWMKPRALQRLQPVLFYRVKHVSSKTVNQILKRLRTKGVIK